MRASLTSEELREAVNRAGNILGGGARVDGAKAQYGSAFQHRT